ncbi:PLAC8 family-domain-containing protein [Aspergillus ambiguus]|uniref:DUF614 domain protein n=1 Tax=Aspergillus ambiguus TaxID=176160 RepID=UPI003CCCDAA6
MQSPEHQTLHSSQHPTWLEEKSHGIQPYQCAPNYLGADHPANYAPYADAAPLRQPSTAPQYSSPAPSHSPDPNPTKNTPDPTGSQQTPPSLLIAPDANPLQSPKSPYFPPPTAVGAPQTPAAFEMGTYHLPGQIQHPNQRIKGGAWSHELGECSNLWTCCLGFMCPCILYGKTQYRLSMLSRKEDPTNMLGYETCNGSCTAMGVLCGCQWLLATIQHTRVRKTYGIRGDIASDCVRATCCTCCTLVQDETEIRKREEERARALRESGAMLSSPYAAPTPMSYGPTLS